jgi:hypothetical protein
MLGSPFLSIYTRATLMHLPTPSGAWACFMLKITEAVVNAVGANKVGIHFSPWSTFQGECD